MNECDLAWRLVPKTTPWANLRSYLVVWNLCSRPRLAWKEYRRLFIIKTYSKIEGDKRLERGGGQHLRASTLHACIVFFNGIRMSFAFTHLLLFLFYPFSRSILFTTKNEDS